MSVVCRGSSGDAKDVEESRRRDESVRNMAWRERRPRGDEDCFQ